MTTHPVLIIPPVFCGLCCQPIVPYMDPKHALFAGPVRARCGQCKVTVEFPMPVTTMRAQVVPDEP